MTLVDPDSIPAVPFVFSLPSPACVPSSTSLCLSGFHQLPNYSILSETDSQGGTQALVTNGISGPLQMEDGL